MRKVFFVVVCSLILCVCSVSAFAGISVEPTVTEVSVEHGVTYTGEYTIKNVGDTEVEVSVQAVDWLKRYLERENTIDVNRWFSCSTEGIWIKPQEVKKIPYTVKIPDEMTEEQVAQIFFAFKNIGPEGTLKTRLGVIFYIAVKGTEKIKSAIEKVAIDTIPQPNGTYYVECRVGVDNTKSNVHVRPHGTVRILKKKEEIAQFAIPVKKGIYAGTIDFVKGLHKKVSLTKGEKYTADVELDCSMYGIEKKLKKKVKVTVQ